MENLVWKQKLWQHLPTVLPQKPFNTNKFDAVKFGSLTRIQNVHQV